MTLQKVVNFRVGFVDNFTSFVLDVSLSHPFDILDLLNKFVAHIADEPALFFKTLVEYVVLFYIFFDLF